MTPFEHSLLSQRDFQGSPEDYLSIHEFLDSTKSHFPHFMHRMILHNSFGIELCERIFGPVVTNSDNLPISTREIARLHIVQDLGRLPSLQDWFKTLTVNRQPWMTMVRQKDLKWLKDNVYKKEETHE